jgi:hypothetical protein
MDGQTNNAINKEDEEKYLAFGCGFFLTKD